MYKQKPFLFSFFILAILIILHIVGSYYSLYWKYAWFEVLVHILSGMWVTLIVLWLALIFGQLNSMKEYRVKSFLISLVSAALIGVIWELIENFGQVTFTRDDGYYINTALDILNDCLGGILAYVYFIQNRKSLDNRCLQNVLPTFYNQIGIIKN